MEVLEMEDAKKLETQKVPEMEEAKTSETHMTSAAAFVEGGIQDACDDACSICLEEFSESEPSTVTNCKHEFHLQCVLEWCQRSSQCPMCWQPVGLKDPASQELLEAVERERNIRTAPARNTTIFHHPALGGFELQHLPVGANDAELEERIIQHLAAAAAMGRIHRVGRREGHRSRQSDHGRPHFLVFSTHPSAHHPDHVSASGANNGTAAGSISSPSNPQTTSGDEPPQIPNFSPLQPDRISFVTGPPDRPESHQGNSSNIRSAASHSPPLNPDRAGPSESQSFPESLKSRFNALSMRYKESISKSTKGWKERLFSRSTSMPGLNSEDQREVNAGMASVSHMVERLETREAGRVNRGSVVRQSNQGNGQTHEENLLNDSNAPASCAASSAAH